jgi:peptide/nickel transport system permease protein
MLLAWGMAIPLGALAAFYRNRWPDRLCGLVCFLGLSMPSLFFSMLMILFAAKTGLFPVGGIHDQVNWHRMGALEKILDTLHHLILPATVLGTIGLAEHMRQMRSQMIEALSQDYIRTARAKGLNWPKTIIKHALPNAINPLITLFGFSLAGLLAGALLTEYVFGWPGLGLLIFEALRDKDEPLVMAAITMLASMLVVGNLIADVLLALLDPRIRLR